MRRNAEELKEFAVHVAYVVGLALLVVAPPVSVFTLIELRMIGPGSFNTGMVVALIGSVLLWGVAAASFQHLRDRRRERALNRIEAWALAAGFVPGEPLPLPKEDERLRLRRGGPGYLADATDIELMPFTLDGEVRVVRAYTRDVRGVEIALVHVALVRDASAGQGKNKATTSLRFTAVIASPLHDLPLAWIEPQAKADRALLAMGAKDVDVESAAFNDRWRVYATDVRAAHGLLSPRVIDHLIDSSAGKHSIALEGPYAITARGGWVRPPEDVEQMVELITGLVDALPEGYRNGSPRRARKPPREGVDAAGATSDTVEASPGSPGGLRESAAMKWVRIPLLLLGWIAVAVALVAPREVGLHGTSFVYVVIGGALLSWVSRRLARFIVGDRRSVRRGS